MRILDSRKEFAIFASIRRIITTCCRLIAMNQHGIRQSRLLSVAIAGILTSSASFAEDTVDDRFGLGEIVVTAHTLNNEMIGGAVVEQKELRTFNKQTVDQALDLVPGTAAANTGGSRNERLVYVRGFDRFETTLSID